tara:strand:- start:192 stop:338 length:147 start_codon:yes stop_codon:yes gene_type:complete
MSEPNTVDGWVIVEIDQLSADEVFIHIKTSQPDGDFEYEGIITGGSDE